MAKFVVNATVHDGSATIIYIDNVTYGSHEIDEKRGGLPTNVAEEYNLKNGTYTTQDSVKPLITFISPTNTSTVAESFTINATVLDMGGVDTTPGSIVLTVGGTPKTVSVNPTNGTTVWVNASVVSTTAPNVPIAILAHDLSGNPNTTQILVNVAHEGVTFTSPTEGFYYNSTPTLRADFVLVNGPTIKMYINGTNVTSSCTIVGGAGTTGSITLNPAYAIAEGQNSVKVNGTYTNFHTYDANSSVTFYKDTIAPIVTVNSITDSDGDTVNEAGETLSIAYTVTDPYLDSVWIGTASSTSSSGTLVFDPAHGNLVGNQNLTVQARDRALNSNQSAPFHVYNNYLVYYNDPSLGTLAGLNLSKTAVYDIFTDNAKAFSLYGPPSNLTTPLFGVFQKNMTGGSKVVIDNRANNSIPAGSLPDKIDVYTTPAGTLDFNISVPNIKNATIMIVKGNSSIVQKLLHGGGMGGLTQSISQNRMVMYGWTTTPSFTYGYDILDASNPGAIVRIGGSGSMKLTPSSINQTIRDNAVDISSGFNTSEKTGLGTPLSISALDKGEYVIAAVCLDNDRFGIIAEKTFFVTDPQGAVLGTDASSYVIGNNVTVTSTVQGDTLAAVVVNKTSVYTGIMDLDMQTLGSSSLKDMSLYADGNTTVKKLFSSKPIWITKGSGGFAKDNATLSVNVSTTDFLPGLYTVYMFLENGGNLTAVGQKTVTISYEQPVQPATVKVNVFNATGDAFVADSIRLSNTTLPWESVVVNQNTATFSGLVNGTTYQVMVNRTGFLNVSATITAVNGQRNVTVNLTQLGELKTPRVVLSENVTIMTPVLLFYQSPTAAKREQLNFTYIITGNDAIALALEFPMRLLCNSSTISTNTVQLDGAPLAYQFNNGTFNMVGNTYTTTNATILINIPGASNGKTLTIMMQGTKRGDARNRQFNNIGSTDALFALQVNTGDRTDLSTFDYADVTGTTRRIQSVDALYILQYVTSVRDEYYNLI